METTVYVHLSEERGYYLQFRPGEPATVSETNTYRRRNNIYCSRYVDCAIYRGGVVGSIDRTVTDVRRTSRLTLSALTATYRLACIAFVIILVRRRL